MKKKKQSHSTDAQGIPRNHHIDAIFGEAESLFANGNYVHAQTLYEEILGLDRNFAPAKRQLGICLFRLGELKQAQRWLNQFVKQTKDDALAYANLAQTDLGLGQLTKAKKNINAALRLKPTADICFLGASIYEQLDDPEKAIKLYHRGLEMEPMRLDARNALGTLYKSTQRYRAAITEFEHILQIEERHVNALSNLGNVYREIGALETAMSCYESASEKNASASIAYNTGLTLQQLGDIPESDKAFETASSFNGDHLETRLQIAENHTIKGQFEAAEEIFDEVLSIDPLNAHASYMKTQNQRFSSVDKEIESALQKIIRSSSALEERILSHFGLGKMLDDCGDYKAAIEHYDSANALKYRTCKSNALAQVSSLNESLCIPNATDVVRSNDWDNDEIRPIFIVGLPRSGSTLTERCLSEQGITTAGEIDYFGPALFRKKQRLVEFSNEPQSDSLSDNDLAILRDGYLQRVGRMVGNAVRFTDKTPENFRYVELLLILFPNAQFVHCSRHPLDTCLSIYTQLFNHLAYSFNLQTIAAYFRRYRVLVNHLEQTYSEHWTNVQYEQLVKQPEEVIEELTLSLLGSQREVGKENNTAPATMNTMSRWQARQSIYTSSLGRWKNYLPTLKEIAETLEVPLEISNG